MHDQRYRESVGGIVPMGIASSPMATQDDGDGIAETVDGGCRHPKSAATLRKAS